MSSGVGKSASLGDMRRSVVNHVIEFVLKKEGFKLIIIFIIKFKKLYFKNFNNFYKCKFLYINIFFNNNRKKKNYLYCY